MRLALTPMLLMLACGGDGRATPPPAMAQAAPPVQIAQPAPAVALAPGEGSQTNADSTPSEALRFGLPAVKCIDETDERGGLRRRRVTAGVYLHGESRFLPLAPELDAQATPGKTIIAGASFDPVTERVITISAEVRTSRESPPLARLDDVRVQAFAVGSTRPELTFDLPARYAQIHPNPINAGDEYFGLEAALVPPGRGLWVRTRVMGPNDPYWDRWLIIDGTGRLALVADGTDSPGRALRVEPHSVQPWAQVAGVRAGALRRPLMVDGRAYDVPVRLRRGDFVRAPGGRALIIVSSQGYNTHPRGYFVDRLDLDSGATVELARTDRGGTAAAVAPDGALYVQVGDELRRYATPNAAPDAYERIDAGVLLVPPTLATDPAMQ